MAGSLWSSSDAAAGGMTLTNGGLTVTPSGGGPWNSIRTTIAQSAGKVYCEILAAEGVTSPQWMFGLASAEMAAGGNFLGNSLYSCAMTAGYVTQGFTSNYTTGYEPVTGDIINLAVDFEANFAWMGFNNVWVSTGDPAAGASPMVTFVDSIVGALFPAMSFYSTGVGIWTLQMSGASQKYAPPAGFSAWDGGGPPPPKKLSAPALMIGV